MSLPFPNNSLPHPDGANLYTILAEHARHQPDKVYLFQSGGSVTYRQMSDMALGLGQAVQARLGEAARPVVAVSMGCETAVLQLVWACLSAGICQAFLPSIPDPEQIAGFMAHIQAGLLITDLPELQGQPRAVSFETLQQAASAIQPITPGVPAQPATPAFIFQTSGTTGAAKWIQVTHGQYLTAIQSMQRAGSLAHAVDQTVYLTPPLSHSYGLSSLLEYSAAGAAIILPESGSTLGAIGDLLSGRQNHLITALEGVSHFYAQLARLIRRIELPKLQHVGFGGGAIDQEAVRQIREVHSGLSYSVRYGLTETPSVVSHKVFRPPYAADWASSGNVLPIYELCIVDEAGAPLPPGQPGQICLRGESLAWPYYGETAVSPFFATGDIGYLHADTQELYIVGRQSAFLKVRGYRLSPEHIEAVITTFNGVIDCRVSGTETGILAEVVPADDGLLPQTLLAFLADRLPSYAIPEKIAFVPAIPRTYSGKVKRHAHKSS